MLDTGTIDKDVWKLMILTFYRSNIVISIYYPNDAPQA